MSKDLNKTAKSIVEKATGNDPDISTLKSAAAMLGRLGGLKGGVARARRPRPKKD